MTRFLLGRVSQPFRRTLVVALATIGLIGGAAAPAVAAPAQVASSPLTVTITDRGCSETGGGDVDFTVENRRRIEVPYTISVYRNREGLVFEGDELAPPAPARGEVSTVTLEYRGLQPAQYRFVVSRNGHTLATARTDFRGCPALPDVPPPPPGQPLSKRLVQQ